MITSTDIRTCTADELRAIVRVMNNSLEWLNTGTPREPIDAQAWLDLYYAANEAGYGSFEDWRSERPEPAWRAWDLAVLGAQQRKAKP